MFNARNPVFGVYEQQRLRSTCAFTGILASRPHDFLLTLACWEILHAFASSILTFSIKKEHLSGVLSEWQTIWIQIRLDVLSGLIWFQTVFLKAISRKGAKTLTKYSWLVSDVCPCKCFAHHGSIIKVFVSSRCQWVMDHFFIFYFVQRGVVDKLLALYPGVPGVPGSTSLSDETLIRDPASWTF